GTTRTSPPPIPKLDFKVQRIGGKLSYLGHVLMENRNRLLVQTMVTEANGTAERDAAMLMAERLPGVKRVTRGADKNYDTKEFVRELRGMNISPCGAEQHESSQRDRPAYHSACWLRGQSTRAETSGRVV